MASIVAPTAARHRRLLAVMLTAAAMFLLAAVDASTKYLSATYSPFQILWIRFLCFFLMVLAVYRHELSRLARSKRLALQFVRSAVLAVEVVAFITAFKYFPLADVHAVAAMCPLLTALLAVTFLGEKVKTGFWIAMGAACAGVILIVKPQLAFDRYVVAVPILGAVLWSAYQILTKVVARTDPNSTTVFFTPVAGIILVAPVMPFVWAMPSPWDWLLLIGGAMLGSLAHILVVVALKYSDAARLQPFNFTIFLWAVVFGIALFGESPGLTVWVGVGVVIAATAYALRERRPTGHPACAAGPLHYSRKVDWFG
jgi:drug/metabolite transporter (DMT)-like permease